MGRDVSNFQARWGSVPSGSMPVSYTHLDVYKRQDLSGYADLGAVSSYAVEALQWTNAEGLVNGTSATTLSPGGNATRAQAAVILSRFCQSIAQ